MAKVPFRAAYAPSLAAEIEVASEYLRRLRSPDEKIRTRAKKSLLLLLVHASTGWVHAPEYADYQVPTE